MDLYQSSSGVDSMVLSFWFFSSSLDAFRYCISLHGSIGTYKTQNPKKIENPQDLNSGVLK